jgi:hypothetical protein
MQVEIPPTEDPSNIGEPTSPAHSTGTSPASVEEGRSDEGDENVFVEPAENPDEYPDTDDDPDDPFLPPRAVDIAAARLNRQIDLVDPRTGAPLEFANVDGELRVIPVPENQSSKSSWMDLISGGFRAVKRAIPVLMNVLSRVIRAVDTAAPQLPSRASVISCIVIVLLLLQLVVWATPTLPSCERDFEARPIVHSQRPAFRFHGIIPSLYWRSSGWHRSDDGCIEHRLWRCVDWACKLSNPPIYPEISAVRRFYIAAAQVIGEDVFGTNFARRVFDAAGYGFEEVRSTVASCLDYFTWTVSHAIALYATVSSAGLMGVPNLWVPPMAAISYIATEYARFKTTSLAFVFWSLVWVNKRSRSKKVEHTIETLLKSVMKKELSPETGDFDKEREDLISLRDFEDYAERDQKERDMREADFLRRLEEQAAAQERTAEFQVHLKTRKRNEDNLNPWLEDDGLWEYRTLLRDELDRLEGLRVMSVMHDDTENDNTRLNARYEEVQALLDELDQFDQESECRLLLPVENVAATPRTAKALQKLVESMKRVDGFDERDFQVLRSGVLFRLRPLSNDFDTKYYDVVKALFPESLIEAELVREKILKYKTKAEENLRACPTSCVGENSVRTINHLPEVVLKRVEMNTQGAVSVHTFQVVVQPGVWRVAQHCIPKGMPTDEFMRQIGVPKGYIARDDEKANRVDPCGRYFTSPKANFAQPLPAVKKGDSVYVYYIGPDEKEKKIGMGTVSWVGNNLADADYQTAMKGTDGGGSSGAPILNKYNEIVGYHEGCVKTDLHRFAFPIGPVKQEVGTGRKAPKMRHRMGGVSTHIEVRPDHLCMEDELSSFLREKKWVRSSDDYLEAFKRAVHSEVDKQRFRLLSSDRLFFDTLLAQTLEEIPLDRNPGYPWVKRFQTKKAVVEELGEKFYDLCWEAFHQMLQNQYEAGYYVFMKQDKYSLKKIAEQKYRTIQGAEFIFMVLLRMVFRDAYKRMLGSSTFPFEVATDTTRVRFGLTQNPNSALDAEVKMNFFSNIENTVGYDYTQFDRNIGEGAWEEFFENFNLGPGSQLFLKNCASISACGKFYGIPHEGTGIKLLQEGRVRGNPSGHPFTSVFNCYVNGSMLNKVGVMKAYVTGDDCLCSGVKDKERTADLLARTYSIEVKVEGVGLQDGRNVFSAPYIGCRLARIAGIAMSVPVDVSRKIAKTQSCDATKEEWMGVAISIIPWFFAYHLNVNFPYTMEKDASEAASFFEDFTERFPDEARMMLSPTRLAMLICGFRPEIGIKSLAKETISNEKDDYTRHASTEPMDARRDKISARVGGPGKTYARLTPKQRAEVNRRLKQAGDATSATKRDEPRISLKAFEALAQRVATLGHVHPKLRVQMQIPRAPSTEATYEAVLAACIAAPEHHSWFPSRFGRSGVACQVVKVRGYHNVTVPSGQTLQISDGCVFQAPDAINPASIAYGLAATGTAATTIPITTLPYTFQPFDLTKPDTTVSGGTAGSPSYCYIPGPGSIEVVVQRADLDKNYPVLIGNSSATNGTHNHHFQVGEDNVAPGGAHYTNAGDRDGESAVAFSPGANFGSQHPNHPQLRVGHASFTNNLLTDVGGVQEYQPAYPAGSSNAYYLSAKFSCVEIKNDTGASVDVVVRTFRHYAIPVVPAYASVFKDFITPESPIAVPPAFTTCDSWGAGNSLGSARFDKVKTLIQHVGSKINPSTIATAAKRHIVGSQRAVTASAVEAPEHRVLGDLAGATGTAAGGYMLRKPIMNAVNKVRGSVAKAPAKAAPELAEAAPEAAEASEGFGAELLGGLEEGAELLAFL